MLNKSNPIGVMDSGIGGLTVVRELQRILPVRTSSTSATAPTAPTATRPQIRSLS